METNETQTEARYYEWLDTHHPEVWDEADFWDDLKRQWLGSLPHYNIHQLLEIFPRGRKTHLQTLKLKIIDQENYRDQLKRQQTKAYHNDAIYIGILLERAEEELAGLEKEYRIITWTGKHKPQARGTTATFITPADVQAAKSIPIQTYYRGNLRKFGTRLVGKCIFHDEHTGSFVIYPDGRAHCFGCQWDGDVIQFVMQQQNLKFLDAVRFILK